MIEMYGYKKCGSCKKTESFLHDSGLEFKFVDITENPPSFEALKKMVSQSSLPIKKFFNTSGLQYRALNIKDLLPKASDDELLELLSKNGRLIKRPILTNGEVTTVGAKADDLERWARGSNL